MGMIFFGLLPFLGLAATVAGIWKKGRDPFDAISKGALIWGTFLAAITSLLSLFSLLSFGYLLFLWLAYCLFFVYRFFRGGWERPALPGLAWPYFVVAAILVLTFLTAVFYPPNNWDSMTYHMARVAHWWQNQSIRPYFTYIPRQIEMAPFAETAILHSYALAKSDLFANIPQWLAFAGTICLAGGIATQLGCQSTGRTAAVLFTTTLPMAILQATSTQNDLIVAFWMLCVAYRYCLWRENPIWTNAVLFGLAVGLAIATKGTAFIFCFPFVVVFAFRSCANPGKLLPKAVIAGILSLAIFGPHFLFLYRATGKPIAGSSTATMVREPTFPRFLVIAAGNLLSNNIIGKKTATELYRRFAGALGIPERDPDTYYYAIAPDFKGYSMHEDTAQHFLHLPAALVAVAYVAIRGGRAARRYCLVWAAAVLLFCTFLKWQPWITRLQLPLLALAAPMFGVMIERMRSRRLANFLFVAFILWSVRPVFGNPSRPLLPRIRIRDGRLQGGEIDWLDNREKVYFTGREDLYAAYASQVAALAAANPESIGLVLGEDSWEYPLWPMLRDRLGHLPAIGHVPMPPQAPASRKYDNPPWQGGIWPETLFVLDSVMPWESDAARAVNPRVYASRDGGYVLLENTTGPKHRSRGQSAGE